jgi:hypothetical protein
LLLKPKPPGICDEARPPPPPLLPEKSLRWAS